jgi:PAS domain S-box-containing protein
MEALEICDVAPLIGSSWIDLWQGADHQAAALAVEAARRGEVGRFVGFFPTTQTHTPKWWDVVVNAICDASGTPEKLLAVSRDVTELREMARKALADSEERFRDLFDEAPIAYVHEGVDTRFIRANRTAMRILGITPEEVPGTYGRTFIPDTPEAQQRLKDALESIGRGTDTSGVILELRRKDNGKPIWIQWWSRPDPSTTYTRTMFIDITDRVLMEQEKARLEAQNTYLQEEIRSDHNFDEIVGTSPALLEALGKVDTVAATDSTVLILGETGTGKELFARAIHARSPRRERPLVKVNCGAIAAGLVESELFGHVKGAFTGALQRRVGRFELAHGGTILLDEVGELPLETQTKLLRILQEQEFEPVGSSHTVRVDVRVIAATNRDLDEAVRTGRFRVDLLYRLNVFPLRVPALRERPQDIPLLISFFVTTLAKRLGKPLEGFSRQSMEQLVAYPWPGNVRELQNIVERAAILARTPILEVEGHLLGRSDATPSASLAPAPAGNGDGPLTLEQMERSYIVNVLRKTNGVVEGPRGAASILDLHPNTLRSRIKKLAIRRGDYEIS